MIKQTCVDAQSFRTCFMNYDKDLLARTGDGAVLQAQNSQRSPEHMALLLFRSKPGHVHLTLLRRLPSPPDHTLSHLAARWVNACKSSRFCWRSSFENLSSVASFSSVSLR